jgi:hypothetical protein
MPAGKVCATAGCPVIVPRGTPHCPAHARRRDQRRGSRQSRGYGANHEKRRAWWALKVAASKVACWRCQVRISPLEEWDLGHCDDDRTIWHGPEHQLCNRGARGTCPHPSHGKG